VMFDVFVEFISVFLMLTDVSWSGVAESSLVKFVLLSESSFEDWCTPNFFSCFWYGFMFFDCLFESILQELKVLVCCCIWCGLG
jgi:hypothetical protein